MWYDLVILAVLAYATIRGAAKGIVWQLAVIASLVLCFVFAESMSLAIAPLIKVAPPLNRWIAMLLLYIGFSFVCFAVARSLKQGIERAKFEEYDRHLGAMFGFVKGVVFALFLTFFGVTLSQNLREQVMHSYSGYAAALVMDRLHPVMPDELHDVLEPYIHQLDRPGIDLRHADHDRSDNNHAGHEHLVRPGGSDGPAPPRRITPGPLEQERHSVPFADGGWFGLGEADLRRLLAGAADSALINRLLESLAAAPSEERDALIRKIASAAPGLADQIFAAIQKPTPATSQPAPAPTLPAGPAADGRPIAADAERRELLAQLASVYYDDAGDQHRFIEEQELLLRGLPARIEAAVLLDWHWDTLSLDPYADPDPETDYRTPLATRIVRQLAASRIPLTSLSSDLQHRLRVQTR